MKTSFKTVKQALLLMQTAYPHMKPPTEQGAKIWLGFFAETNAEEFLKAVKSHVATSKFIPTVADINEKLNDNSLEAWDEAWGKVLKAVRRFGTYNEKEARLALGETFQAVDCLGWKNICLAPSSNLGTLRAQFRDVFKSNKQRVSTKKSLARSLTGSTMNLIQDVASKAQISGGK